MNYSLKGLPPVRKMECYTLRVANLAEDGNGVGRIGQFAVFCEGLLPGECAEVQIIKVAPHYAVARPLRLLEASPDRREPFCPSYKQCGGCTMGHMTYEAQLAAKERHVTDCLQRIGSFGKGAEELSWMRPILGMEDPFHYRNKSQYPFGRKDDGTIQCGFYQKRSHRLVPLDNCFLETEQATEIRKKITSYFSRQRLSVYDESSGEGLLRSLLIRVSSLTGQAMVVLVINGESLPGLETFLAWLPEELPMVVSCYLNCHTKQTNVLLGETFLHVYGSFFLLDAIDGVEFELSPESFFQINNRQTDRLYRTVDEMAALRGGEIVWDLFCGIGTIGLYLAVKNRDAGRPLGLLRGVEYVEKATEDAQRNAARHHVGNARFYAGDVADVLIQLAGDGQELAPDVVVLDPPRKGCEQLVLERVAALEPQKVIYVSCNPATLARDLALLAERGYTCLAAQPVDMFPWSGHVETVVMLSHKSPDSVINVKVEFGEGEGKVPLDRIVERAKKYQPKPKITYKMIQEYVEKKYGFKVHTAYIAEVKRSLGLTMHDAPNAVEDLKQLRKYPAEEKVEAIKDALKYFEVI